MPKPIKRKEMLRRLRALGWEGPFQKGSHPFMIKDGQRLTIPNPPRHRLVIDETNPETGRYSSTRMGTTLMYRSQQA